MLVSSASPLPRKESQAEDTGNMGHRIPLARKFNADFGCNVFMLSYRGYAFSQLAPASNQLMGDSYGESEGKASEHGKLVNPH